MTMAPPTVSTERPEDWITGVVLHMDPEQGDCYMDVHPQHSKAELVEALKAAQVYNFFPCDADDGSDVPELTETGAVRYWLYQA